MGDKVFVATHGQGHRLLVRNLRFLDSHECLRPSSHPWEKFGISWSSQSFHRAAPAQTPHHGHLLDPDPTLQALLGRVRESCVPLGKVWSWEDTGREDSQVWR